MAQLWLKHRPDTLSHMVGLDSIKADAPNWVAYENNKYVLKCGGVIFNGPPGTGKTSASRAIAKDHLGPAFEANYHEFNASDERGIQFIRDRLKGLAQQKATNSPFKIINLDEADGLTRDAQDALRQIIEQTSTHTLWILTCNRISKIIPALRSRLPSYSFKPIESDEAQGFLERVIEIEGFPTEWISLIPSLIEGKKGDLRACLKTMQICDPKDPDGLLDHLSDSHDAIDQLYEAIDTEDFGDAMECAETIVAEGLSRDDVISTLHGNLLTQYKENNLSLGVVLKRTLILGQWAAKSPDWTSGDLLFLHAMIGDYYNRG